jgi:uncharacterized membrane protein YjgN (DUF898 family)
MSNVETLPPANVGRQSPPSPAGEPIRIDYVPRPGLLRLTLVNALLGLVTLTLYRFWARTDVRRHIWACVHINGQPLEYTGCGVELFKGALIVFVVLGLPALLSVAAVNIAYGPEHPATGAIQILLFLIVSVLWGAAVFRARRYQLSRTLWRGIRGGLEGSATTYSLTYFGAMLARGMSLGWSTPVMNFNLQQQIIGGMRFGDLPFSFKGRAGPLYPTYALCWFLTLAFLVGALVLLGFGAAHFAGGELGTALADIFNEDSTSDESQLRIVGLVVAGLVTLFLVYALLYPVIWSFYTARELVTFATYTRLGPAQFRLNATAGSIIGLTVGNFLLWLFTLGIAAPFIQQRLIRYLCDRISVEGLVNIDRVLQSKQPLDKTGEGLADAFDVGGL